MKRLGIPLIILASLALGCGSGSSRSDGLFGSFGAGSNGRTITIKNVALDQLQVGGDRPDTLDVEGFNAQGVRVFGPVRFPLATSNAIPNIPPEVVRLELDFLRNNGFRLFRADAGLTSSNSEIVPLMQLTAPNDSEFRITANGAGGFSLSRQIIGDAPSPSDVRSKLDATNMVFKGVCYSPAPINFSNKDAPAVGDLFWDSFKAGPDDIFDWGALFLDFYDPNVGQSRADIKTIRNMGCNSLRLYSAISYHLNDDGTFPDLSAPTTHRFSHKKFLDACWNNNDRPIYVLVDIPMPTECFRRYLKDAEDIPAGPDRDRIKAQRAAKIAWWEANLRATVEDLSSHPAVIGFNIMNEQDGNEWSHPNQGAGPDDQESQFFYAQSIKYASIVKGVDNTKLCGWAFHDSPALVKFASNFPTNGLKYFEQLKQYFDYYGINSYQKTSLDSIGGKGQPGSYADLPDNMALPVLFTELGWPATGHDNSNQLIDTPATQAATAQTLGTVVPQVYQNKLYMGCFYFEFADEWWKQDVGLPYTWDPGNPDGGRPNGFGDEEGFGLFSVARQGGRPNQDDNYITFGPDPKAPFGPKGPKLPFDKITGRQPIIDALKAAFSAVQDS
ncbi:hypothetical protein JST97_03265 [bacterium]|nr:hypothetical protein [bacterium]